MLNKILLIGHVGADPEAGQSADGNNYARFRLATTERSFTTLRGQVVPERTTWHNCECWGGLARVVQENVRKGDKLYVEAVHHTRDYQEKDGRTNTWHYNDVAYLEFLSAKSNQQQVTDKSNQQPKSNKK